MAEMTNNAGFGGVNPEGVMAFAGATVSLGLLVGMGIWGYNLVVRDVQGIPVVQAAEGPMREAPLNPGGELVLNTGLAVNDVAALGGATDPGDRLALAPVSPGLTEEDLLVQPTAEAGEVRVGDAPRITVTPSAQFAEASLGDAATASVENTSGATALMTAEEIIALADEIAAETAPLSALIDEPEGVLADANAIGADTRETSGITLISQDLPGVRLAFRPPMRPTSFGAIDDTGAVVAQITNPDVTVSAIEEVVSGTQDIATTAPINSGTIPVGTTLVQLGAFDSAQVAQTTWTELRTRFSDVIGQKNMVVQEATSGGRQFFRLRALGFTDVADARRFCSVLTAQQVACLPVVVQ